MAAKPAVITAAKLLKKLADGRDVVVLEVRRTAPETPDEHIPNAHVVALATDLVGPADPAAGNQPLPTQTQVAGAVRRWGINPDSLVVVYSSENPAIAARAWWTLRWAGLAKVRYLDGGSAAWTRAGGSLTSEVTPEGAGSATVQLGSVPVLDADSAATLAHNGVLIDARGAEGYAKGHIPGGRLLPSSDTVDADGKLKSDEALRELFAAAGVSDGVSVGTYCGGGTSATLAALALAKIGIDATLYPGSFSAYRYDPLRPIETGDGPATETDRHRRR